MTAQPRAYVELSFAPSWDLISDVRRFVSVFYQRMLDESDAASRVALAVHELLENATKYSTDGVVQMRLEVADGEPPTTLRVSVKNRAHVQEIERLQQQFALMEAGGEPMAYYQQLMRTRAAERDRAGLGLARIQAEAEMRLRYEVQQDWVSIQGVTGVTGPVAE